ncbi:MAG: transporter substrate-binding domain-containing protein [Planctomycetota bacterium]
MRSLNPCLAGLLALFLCAPTAWPQDAAPLRVATKLAAPFVMQDESTGDLYGLTIDLWTRIAADLELEYELEIVELDTLLDGVAAGTYDAGVAAITITPAREERLDMSHGYFSDGLGIAVPAGRRTGSWFRAIGNIFTPAFASAVGALALLLLGVGFVIWLVERKRNSEHFREKPAAGLGDGFWFAAVTMTTVGYGDKSPSTLAGKLVSLVWMFASIIVISAFTGAIASSLTAAQIDAGVRGPEDLRGSLVGAPDGSATITTLATRGVNPRPFASIEEGLDAVARGELDAFVHDASILRYTVANAYAGEARVLDAQFDWGAYAIALPQGSALREPINREILKFTRDDAWEQRIRAVLGIR